jgi:8-oxo-dGTP pyrophosphatase MutT (NUDIX family)
MGIFSHDIYDNIRTRTLVLRDGCILLHPPGKEGDIWGSGAWGLPGGGLEPHESLAECARREVLEETGIVVRVGPIAFLREWVVPSSGSGWCRATRLHSSRARAMVMAWRCSTTRTPKSPSQCHARNVPRIRRHAGSRSPRRQICPSGPRK